MQVRQLQENELEAYHAFIAANPTGDVLQTAAWARLKALSGWRAHYLLAEDDGRPAAACLALERPLPKIPATILYCPRGPVMDWTNPTALPAITNALRSLGRQRRAVLVKADPAVPEGEGAAAEALQRQGFRPVESGGFGGVQPRCVMKLDLSAGLDAVFAGFKPKWRYNVRVAEKKGVTARLAEPQEIDTFYDILLETARRDHFLVRGREYFHAMMDELGRDGLISLFLTEYEGKAIAGALLYVMGQQAWYTYGASSNEHRNVMPNHLMQWAMMQHAAERGCRIYDFRGVSCNEEAAEGDHLQGLNRFKAGFGAQFIRYIGEFDLPLRQPLYFGWTRLAPAALRLLKRRAAQEVE